MSPFRVAPKHNQDDDQLCLVAHDVIKDYRIGHTRKRVLKGLSFEVPRGARMAILGRNGAGKSTLIRLLAGVEPLTSGSIRRYQSMSWPLALSGGLHGEMTGYDAVRFISTAYGSDFQEMIDFVSDFSELGPALFEEIGRYSSGMTARLGFALSLALDFDCYLIDEVIMVGDQRFQQKARQAFFGKSENRSMIVAIHDINFVREHCTSALVLDGGRGRQFHDLDLATDIYATL